MATAAIAVKNLTKYYGEGGGRFAALRGVNVKARLGESLAVVGKSGSGKSTLMHLMALLDQPSAGSVHVLGQDATGLRTADLEQTRNETFGFVFQQFFLVPGATVLENVVLPLTVAGVPRRERRRRAMETLEQLEMADKAGNRATDLSGGQKQRVAIARALVNNPSVIFADEPTGNLDSVTGGVVEDLLFALNRDRAITVVVVTHDEALAARCDRQVYLKDGLVVTRAELAA
ncbi:ABC transporter ATP-binding protein [Jannaschia sp. R86511]|uniref:ABC transporter ATP-binding protein n=1 Tax=Jannaschia sp. R86511 TaxID=3093853 RepID=UPI0036D2E421